MAHQSLYRRYRPRRFADLRGQDHVVKALRNAVAQGSEGHAYLFSGPRGTGKTSTARILAKALNCLDLVDGEPCGVCESCLSIEHGNSYDLFELDAASNNGVDAMRELISRTVVGSPGRTKVYILDEVHMLSAAASNALLKTLEEPPEHVCFVLATTDPQKVLPTIRSRTQHFEFSLLSATELADYVRWISEDAGLGVDEESVAHVVRQGRGSARDTLSTLDMVVAAGGVSDRAESVSEIMLALVDRDTARVMIAVADAVAQGREPRVLAEQLLVSLRDAFLSSVHAGLDHLSDSDQEQMAQLATSLGTATITRALESVGAAMVDMRQAADPRVPLEVALIRLTSPATDTSASALLERIEELERRVARGVVAPAGSAAPAAPAAPAPPPAAAKGPAAPGSHSAPAAPASPRATAPSAPAPVTPVAPVVDDPGQYDAEPAAGTPSSPAAIRAELARKRGDAPAPVPRAAVVAEPTGVPGAAPSRPGAAPSAPGRPSSSAAPTPAPAPAPPAPLQAVPPVAASSEDTADPAPVAAAHAPGPGPSPALSLVPDPPAAAESDALPSVDELGAAMTESVLGAVKGMAKAIYSGGRFLEVSNGRAVFVLNNAATCERAERSRTDVEAALAAHFGRPVPLKLIDEDAASKAGGPAAPGAAARTDAGSSTGTAANGPPAASAGGEATTPTVADEFEDEHLIDLSQLEDATDVSTSGVDKVIQAFPGAALIDEEN